MAKKKVKKCYRCGVVVESYSYGDYCSKCAADVWDAGFESTTQHAEEIYEAELKEKEEINELLSHPPVSFEKIRKQIKYTNGTFRCKNCRKLRLNWVHFGDDENEAKLEKMLNTACPKCKDSGNFTFK